MPSLETGLNYKCPKCSHSRYELGEIRAAGGFWSKIFDVQGKRFSTVTCSHCKYTEMFKAETSMLGNIFDLFTG
ncbi:MAG: zinc ribbon domain-containing protein [candidate division Zixibacteria bacterium]|nr:zinc ribbon domain-containing protein [candidate division Zixibacteria bacterium]